MAFRTWGRLLLTALGVSVLAGAGQLGIAYGFGVVRLDGAFTDGSVNRWPAQLAWIGWFAAGAAVIGAVLTERLARRDGLSGSTAEQLAVTGGAALGAIVVAPLCMQPARAAELGGTVDPVWAIGICAILGAVVGAGAAIAVLLKPPFGWNIALTAAAVWLLALVSAAPSAVSAGPLLTVRLGVLEPSGLGAETAQRLAMLILPLVALLAGAAVGALARRRGHLPLVGGAAGAAGPVLLAFAYLTAGPGSAADRYQLAPYYGALIAVAAGALGSTAATALRRPAAAAGTGALEPTDILQPLPPSPAVGPADAAPAAGRDHAAPSPPAVDPAAGSVPATGGTRGELGLAGAAPEAGAPGAVPPAPAHWEWPVSPGSGVTPVPAGPPRAGRTAAGATTSADHTPAGAPTPAAETASTAAPEPAAPGTETASPRTSDTAAPQGAETIAEGADESATWRDAAELTRGLPASGLLSTGRRTSAIDVLAAGRPAVAQPPGPEARTSATAATASAPAPARERLTGARPPRRSEQAATTVSEPSGSPASVPAATPEPAGTGPLADPAPAAAGVGPGHDLPADETSPRTDGNELPPGSPPRGSTRRRSRHGTPSSPTVDAAALAPAGADAPRADAGAPPADPGPRSKRGRKGRTSSATGLARVGEPAGPTPADPPAAVDVPQRPDTVAAPAPGPEPAAAEADATTAEGRRGTRGYLFSDPEPAGPELGGSGQAPGAPRSRVPIFEDVTNRPGDVRPAWPIAPSRPVDPHGTTGTAGTAGTPESAGVPADETRVEPAPRPRHRALPDLTSASGWEALATARHAAPGAPSSDPSDGGHGDGTERGTTDPASHEESTEPGGGTPKPRRGLFRRNRARADGDDGGADRAESASEPLPAQDEEYVDWVAGLASDADPEGTGMLRSGRHHRD
ncbi:hypothetical protein [Micromonospora sp. SL4-19]|uniref:hypothetical protein n=1 Tax=Micromonospora sp. SL4-19 TaxID=3399129 RepID=UPI003A4D1E08